MCQDLGMPEDVIHLGRLIWSVEAFHIALVRKRMMRLAEHDCCGADRHRKTVKLGLTSFHDVQEKGRA